MTTSTDMPNPDERPRTFSSTTRLIGSLTKGANVVAIAHEGVDLVVAVAPRHQAANIAQAAGGFIGVPGEPLASAALKRSDVVVLVEELQRFLYATASGQHSPSGHHYNLGQGLIVIPPAEAEPAVIEELESDLTPEQDARVSALHQAAAVSGRLIEALGGGHISFETEDVLAFARWVISGDATVEPVAVATAEQAADQ